MKKGFSKAVTGKWTPESNLHVTYKFLGDTGEDGLALVREALTGVLPSPLQAGISVCGAGFFTPREPRILFAKLSDPAGELSRAFEKIEELLEKIGYQREKRPFAPHVTLMRIKSFDMAALAEAIRSHGTFSCEAMGPLRVDIIESVLGPAGPAYSPLAL